MNVPPEEPTAKLAWQLDPAAELRLHAWDDGAVVHHAAANDTHQLSAAAGRLLTLLGERGPMSAGDLQSLLPGDDVDEMLAQLQRLSLVVSCPH